MGGITIPTMKSFCGCCDLKVPCIVLAVLRMIVYIVGVLAYLYIFVFLEMVLQDKPNRSFKDEQVDYLIRILVFVVSVNVFVTILFIIGVRSKNAAKMQYYVVTVGLNAVLFLYLFKIILAVIAVVECFILLCSYSLYKEYQSNSHEGAMGAVYVYQTVNTVAIPDNDPSQPTAKQDL